MSGINLNTIISESQRDDVPLTIGEVTYALPGEFPLDVLAPFMAENLDLSAVIADVVKAITDKDTGVSISDLVVDTLLDHPSLPLDLVKAAGASLELLLGAEAYAAFWATRPSIPAIRGFAQALVAHYGVTLLDFSDSDDSSPTTGEPSKPTSSGSTDSTPEASGDAQETPVGS